MHITFTFSTTILFAVLATTGVSTREQSSAARQQRMPPSAIEPMSESPLTATSEAVFAVDSDGSRILRRPADLSRPWEVFERAGRFRWIAGMAASGTGLWVTDPVEGAIYRIDASTGERTRLVGKGPLESPGSIAVAGDVFVSDSATGIVYRIRGGDLTVVRLDASAARSVTTSRGELFLAGWGNDLFVASPDGQISEFRGIGTANPEQPQRVQPQARQQPIADKTLQFTVELFSRTIARPSQLAVHNGIVYVIDRATRQVLAYNRTDRKAVRTGLGPLRSPTGVGSVAVNNRSVYVMAAGRIERSPRIVPALVRLRTVNRSESMRLVYDYLYRNRILPLKDVPLDTNLETTLRREQILVRPDRYASSWDRLVCVWNPSLCVGPDTLRPLKQGAMVRIPDVQPEPFIDTTEVVLDGSRTLGEVADERIRNEQFRPWATEERLRAINEAELVKANVPSARGARTGTYFAPIEYLQYRIPVLVEDLPPTGELRSVEATYPGVRILSLEERPAVQGASTLQPQPLPLPVPLSKVKDQLKDRFGQLQKRVNYTPLKEPPKWALRIGVAEKQAFDVRHPDLAGAITNVAADGEGGADAVATFEVRRPRDDGSDHATMVAAIIAARTSGFDHTGLVPVASLLALDGNDPAIGADVDGSQDTGVRLFNVSEHFGPGAQPQVLLDAVLEHKALYVVAAGNDSKEICTKFRVYPACWHDEPNVLVVAATDDGGATLMSDTNWSGAAVHLAAPGEGFYAAGFDRSYVPVSGTSFATPVVTAAAAMLYGLHGLDPWKIKQRLVATADPLTGAGKEIVGGRLNIGRALADIGYGVLTGFDEDEKKTVTQRITLHQDTQITVRVRGSNLPIAVQDLRRVYRLKDGSYRIVYVTRDPDNPQSERLRLITSATFPTERADKFKALTDSGKEIPIGLLEWLDYVAPIQ